MNDKSFCFCSQHDSIDVSGPPKVSTGINFSSSQPADLSGHNSEKEINNFHEFDFDICEEMQQGFEFLSLRNKS